MPKILLVEDNEMNRDMLSRRLLKAGFEMVMAVDGEQAIDLARSEAPDLILMDISLPGLDGWEATRRLKAMPETRSIPIIALTAHAMAGDREKSLAAGCNDYDTKPIDFRRLMEKIQGFLGKETPAQDFIKTLKLFFPPPPPKGGRGLSLTSFFYDHRPLPVPPPFWSSSSPSPASGSRDLFGRVPGRRSELTWRIWVLLIMNTDRDLQCRNRA